MSPPSGGRAEIQFMAFEAARGLQLWLYVKKTIQTLILMTTLVSALASALKAQADDTGLPAAPADAANTGGHDAPPVHLSSRNDGRLDFRDIETLYPGALPGLHRTDMFYRNGHGSNLCRYDWHRMRRLPVNKRTVTVTFRALKAKAQEVGLPENKLRKILATFLANQSAIPNQDHIAVIDYDKSSLRKRMFIINLRDGTITAHQVMHGSGSGARGGFARAFSNEGGTNASSLGCSLATFNRDTRGRKLYDSHGRHKLMFQGLEASNDQECNRAIFMHPADYAPNGGRSHGCPAVNYKDKADIYDKISGGGLVCAYRDGNTTVNHNRVRARH